ncbi:Fe-S cluster assembly ATPase SufC [bacterium]|nr:Fe-S cluster assembly ATPase SufC [bacterium]
MGASLQIQNLRVAVGEQSLLAGVNLRLAPGEVYVLLGPNGAGKSTLARTLAGDESLRVTADKFCLNDQDLLPMTANERALAGVFVSWQNPPAITGVTVANLIRISREQLGLAASPWETRRDLLETLKVVGLDGSYADREFNVGFSGGERKKLELAQLLSLAPQLAVLDELDSGLDADAIKILAENLERVRDTQVTMLVITHRTELVKKLRCDRAGVMIRGQIVYEGDQNVIEEIEKDGYTKYFSSKYDSTADR